MQEKIKTISNFLLTYSSILAISIYLILSFTWLPSKNHLMFNLEPYPDGLLYVIPAYNLATKGSFLLEHQGTYLKANVPPLYSALLAVIYSVIPKIEMFYILNIFLGMASLILFSKSLQNIQLSKFIQLIVLLLYIFQASLYFIAWLPMTENLVFLISNLLLYLITATKDSPGKILLASTAVFLLLLTRNQLIPTALMFFLLFTASLFLNKQYKYLIYFTIAGLGATIVFIWHQYFWLSGGLHNSFSSSVINESLGTTTTFSIGYLQKNLIFYGNVLTGSNKLFLWQEMRLVSPILAILSILGLVYAFYSPITRVLRIYSQICVLLSTQLAIALFFYVSDARYLTFFIPFINFLAAFGLAFLLLKLHKYIRNALVLPLAIVLIFVSHILMQAKLFEYVISANAFQNTMAWQYQAVKHFDWFFSSNGQITKPVLITALPPYYIDAFAKHSVTTLPLATHQEFISKNQIVWDFPFTQWALPIQYKKLASHNQPLFITNAYITHQQAVIDDYEEYKKHFNFELVSEGCMGACNIYKLTLNDASSSASLDPK